MIVCMEMWLIPAVVVAFAVAITLIIVQDVVIRRFLSTTERISSDQDMERFKEVARFGMWLTVIDLPFLLVCIASCFIIPYTYGKEGLVTVLVLNGFLIFAGAKGRKSEHRVRNLPCDTDELREEQRHVSESWLHKLLPDF